MDPFMQILQEYGPLIAAVAFFLWRDYKREDRLSTRVEKLEDEQRHIILPLVEKSTAVIARNTEVMERLETSLQAIGPSDANKSKS